LRWLHAQPPDLEEVHEAPRPYRRGRHASRQCHRRDPGPSSRRCRRGRLAWTSTRQSARVIALTRGEAAKTGVSVQTDLADGLPPIYGDRVQLQQVILNLIINAIEAMSGIAETPRALLISTGRAEQGGGVRRGARFGSGTGFRRALSTSSTHSTRPSPVAWAWDWRSAVRSSRRTRDSCAPPRNEPRGAVFQFTLPLQRDETLRAERAGPMSAA